jgi:hypothetical protein
VAVLWQEILLADVCLNLTSNYGVENPASFRTQQKRDYNEEDEEERIQKEKKKKFRFQLFSKHPLFQQIQNEKTKMKKREKGKQRGTALFRIISSFFRCWKTSSASFRFSMMYFRFFQNWSVFFSTAIPHL